MLSELANAIRTPHIIHARRDDLWDVLTVDGEGHVGQANGLDGDKEIRKYWERLGRDGLSPIRWNADVIATARDSFESIVECEKFPGEQIVKHLPRHKCYVQVCGGLPLFLYRDPSPVEVYNDYRSRIVDFFAVLRDPKALTRLALLRRLWPLWIDGPDYNEWLLVHRCEGSKLSINVANFCWYLVLLGAFRQRPYDGLFGQQRRYRAWRNLPLANKLYDVFQELDDDLPDLLGRLLRVQYEENYIAKMVQLYDDPSTLFVVDARGAQSDSDIEPLVKTKGAVAILAPAAEEFPGECRYRFDGGALWVKTRSK